jgi:hypothetical protein
MAQWPERTIKPVRPFKHRPEPAQPVPPIDHRSEPPQTSSQPSIWQRWGFKPPPAPTEVRGGQLQVVLDESPGQVYSIGAEEVRIGRARDNQVRLYHRSVSRYHAHIRYANGRFYLQDQGSTHGTYVNGQRVEAVALNDRDRIQIGETEILFRIV